MSCSIKKPAKLPRIIAGVGIIILGIYLQSYWGLLGFIPIIFAIIGYCPLCSVKAKTFKKE
ncbi:MAG: YgaP family membrane protein [Campylobacterota bacterium]